MKKIPNSKTPKSMPLILRKHLGKFRATEMYAYTFISLLFIRTCRNQIKYNFLSKKNQTKI